MDDNSQRVDRCDGEECCIDNGHWIRKDMCLERDFSDWQCTLPKGHRGKHVACGIGEHNLAVW